MDNNRKAFWLWLLQRVSAALLLIVLALHLFYVHYAQLGKPILFSGTTLRLKDLSYFSVTALLLLAGLFHGLNGLRAILLDYDFFEKHEKAISWALLLAGVIFFLGGVKGLWAFLIIK
jgi:succinate dehydrogenase hydrophobic anchor subunit